MSTVRLTTAQALVRYLAALHTGAGNAKVPLFGGVFAIFGHGNVAGIGEALYRHREALPTYRAHNEQAMAHIAIAYAKAHMRRRVMACTSAGAVTFGLPSRSPPIQLPICRNGGKRAGRPCSVSALSISA